MRVQTLFCLEERCGLRLLYLCLITAHCQLLSDIIFLPIMYCDRVVPLRIIVIPCFLRLNKYHKYPGNSFDKGVLILLKSRPKYWQTVFFRGIRMRLIVKLMSTCQSWTYLNVATLDLNLMTKKEVLWHVHTAGERYRYRERDWHWRQWAWSQSQSQFSVNIFA